MKDKHTIKICLLVVTSHQIFPSDLSSDHNRFIEGLNFINKCICIELSSYQVVNFPFEKRQRIDFLTTKPLL